MTPEQYARVREVFERLCELRGEDREAALGAETDPEVRRKVRSMLERDAEAESGALDTPALGGSFHVAAAIDDRAPERIGAYRILERVGAGGMGYVFRGMQESPRREVAIKLLRPGARSADVLRRFELEAHVLGRLQHPGIAQIHEAGTFDAGAGAQPFFAMELVRGRSLVRYAEEECLSIERRLGLLLLVCDAVHHAHQRGIIHRDLKPDNILVDERGRPRVLDFGVARLTDADIDVTGAETRAGQLVGTVAYMSPEQVGGEEIDTRADVYALGVVGFELLTGRLPHDLSGLPLHRAAARICEAEPATLGSVAPSLRGDLSTVFAKALRMDPDQRYGSVSEFGADIDRYMRDQPVSARPATAAYQLRKFARRNRALVAGSAAAVVALVAIAGVASWQAVAATRAQSLAEREAAKFAASHDFLIHEMLFAVTPDASAGREVDLYEILLRASERVGEALAHEPEVEASVRHSLGEVYTQLGDYEHARDHLRRAVRLRESALGPDHVDTLRSVLQLCSALKREGRLDEADPLQVRAFEGLRRELGAEHPEVLDAWNNLGTLRSRQERFSEAAEIHRRILDIRLRIGDSDDPKLYYSMHNLASALDRLDRVEEAEALYRSAIEGKRRTEGPTHPSTLLSMINRDNALRMLGRLDEAEVTSRDTLVLCERVFGPEHDYVSHSLEALADVLVERGDRPALEEAESLLRRSLDIRTRTLAPESWRLANSQVTLADCLLRLGREEDAEPVLVRAAERLRDTLGPASGRTRRAASMLAELYENTGREDEAATWRALVADGP